MKTFVLDPTLTADGTAAAPLLYTLAVTKPFVEDAAAETMLQNDAPEPAIVEDASCIKTVSVDTTPVIAQSYTFVVDAA